MSQQILPQRPRRFWTLIGIQMLIVAALLISAATMSMAISRTKSYDNHLLKLRSTIVQVNLDLVALQHSLDLYIATNDPAHLDVYRQKLPEIDTNLHDLEVDSTLPEQMRADLATIRNDIAQWQIGYAERQIALMQAENIEQARAMFDETTPRSEMIVQKVQAIRLQIIDINRINNDQIEILNWVVFGTVAVLSVLLFASTALLTQMWRREGGLVRELQALTGDLQHSNDELKISAAKHEKSNLRLQTRIKETRLINEINAALVGSDTNFFSIIAHEVGTLLNDWCSIWMLDSLTQPTDQLTLQALYHPNAEKLEVIREWIAHQNVTTTVGLHAPLFTEGRPSVVLLEVPEAVRRPFDIPEELEPLVDLINLTSYIAVPIMLHQRPVGLIAVSSSMSGRIFDPEQELFLIQVADRIAHRVQYDQLLALSEQRAAELQASFDSINDIVAVYDDAGQQQILNRAAQAFLATESEIHPLVFLRPNGSPLPIDEHPVRLALTGQTVADMELSITTPDGHQVVHTISAAPIHGPRQAITGAVLVARDITARKDLDRLKDEFLANMSHELRTPLTAIMGYSELLLRRRAEVLTPWHVSKIEGVRAGGQRLLTLVNDLLDLAKLDAGQIELHRHESDLHALIENQHTLLLPSLQSKHLRFRRQFASNLPRLTLDSDRINQVLMNLLSNAIKFTPDHGVITVSTALVSINKNDIQWSDPAQEIALPAVGQGTYVVVTVADTGVGIPAEALPHLWDRFYQVEGSASRRFGGTGLGLAIVQQLVELHGGTVWAQSGGIDQGSLFGMLLPVVQYPIEQTLTSGMPTIFVIDYDYQNSELYRSSLYKAGYNVVVAHNRAEALHLAEQITPAAITIDLTLPDSEGWSILATLRQFPHLASTPVIGATINPEPEPTPVLGVSTFLIKPIQGPQLVAVVRQILGQQQPDTWVLIVDDDTELVELIQMTLLEYDLASRTASDGAKALDLLQQEPLPGLILLDLALPIVDGFQLLARLRDDQRTRHLPVVVLTARDLNATEIRQLRFAAQGLYAKHSLNLDTLVAAIQRHVPTQEDTPNAGNNHDH